LYDLTELIEIFGGQDQVKFLVSTFIETIVPEIELLKFEAVNGNLSAVKNTIHKIRPTLLQIHSAIMAEKMEQLKRPLEDNDVENVKEIVFEMEAAMIQIVENMNLEYQI